MIDPHWRIDDPDPDEVAAGGAQPILVSLHFLKAALRRRWRLWFGIALLGMAAGLVLSYAMPAANTATVTVLLAHPASNDSKQAMDTDMSLLGTRAVAAAVVERLKLDMTPDAFQHSFTAEPVTSQVLVLNVAGPTNDAAVARAKALSEEFLAFRTENMRTQSRALIDGYQKRVDTLKNEVSTLTTQYNAASGAGANGQAQASELLSQRSQANSEVTRLQQTIEDTTLQTDSVTDASYVVDSAAAVLHSTKRRLVLNVASGLVGGAALGVGLVVFMALTSDRLRRREDVSLALDTPVRFSVHSVGLRGTSRSRRIVKKLPLNAMASRRGWGFRVGRHGSSPARDLDYLVHGLEVLILPHAGRPALNLAPGRHAKVPMSPKRPERLALGTVDNAAAAELIIGSLGVHLCLRGLSVFLVDLSESGTLHETVASAVRREGADASPTGTPVVFRPEGVPSLAKGPIGAPVGTITELAEDDPRRPDWDEADVILTLAEVDPAVGVDHLRSWVDQVFLLVTAGRSSAERLRTAAQLIRTAELALPFAVMVGVEPTDESFGQPGLTRGERSAPRGSAAW